MIGSAGDGGPCGLIRTDADGPRGIARPVGARRGATGFAYPIATLESTAVLLGPARRCPVPRRARDMRHAPDVGPGASGAIPTPSPFRYMYRFVSDMPPLLKAVRSGT